MPVETAPTPFEPLRSPSKAYRDLPRHEPLHWYPPIVAARAMPAGKTPTPVQTVTVTVQVPTPNPEAVDRAEAAIRGIPGVKSVVTTSLALGGTSVMRVTYQGDPAALNAALSARGLR